MQTQLLWQKTNDVWRVLTKRQTETVHTVLRHAYTIRAVAREYPDDDVNDVGRDRRPTVDTDRVTH